MMNRVGAGKELNELDHLFIQANAEWKILNVKMSSNLSCLKSVKQNDGTEY